MTMKGGYLMVLTASVIIRGEIELSFCLRNVFPWQQPQKSLFPIHKMCKRFNTNQG